MSDTTTKEPRFTLRKLLQGLGAFIAIFQGAVLPVLTNGEVSPSPPALAVAALMMGVGTAIDRDRLAKATDALRGKA